MSGNDAAAVFFVGGGRSDSQGVSPDVVGTKAYNLMRMDRAGLPVPPAFVIGTPMCRDYLASARQLPHGFGDLLATNIRRLENVTGRTFGGRRRPLLVSVRSGAPVSMPGMMESVLNVGLNDVTVNGLIRLTGNPRLAWDSYRRLIESYAGVVHGCAPSAFDTLACTYLDPVLFPTLRELDAVSLKRLAQACLEQFRAINGVDFPADPIAQLSACIAAVFRSWNSDKAVAYRRMNGIGDTLGTAVTVQAMVFGNAGGTSGSGVGFTRDPASGDNTLLLDFVFNAQGEDVVGGRHTMNDAARLQHRLPELYARLQRVRNLLESEFRDLQDFEVTVQEGELFLLQTRSGNRAPWAALKVAVEQVDEGLIDVPCALARLASLDLDAIERVHLQVPDGAVCLARATAAGIGSTSGVVALDIDEARRLADAGMPVILVREEIVTQDIDGFAAARGILSARGGRTAHAAVVARQMDKACLVGCKALEIDLPAQSCRIGDTVVKAGDWLSLDGDQGRVFAGRIDVAYEKPSAFVQRVKGWRREATIA